MTSRLQTTIQSRRLCMYIRRTDKQNADYRNQIKYMCTWKHQTSSTEPDNCVLRLYIHRVRVKKWNIHSLRRSSNQLVFETNSLCLCLVAKPSLQRLRLIVSKTVRLLDLRKQWCSAFYWRSSISSKKLTNKTQLMQDMCLFKSTN